MEQAQTDRLGVAGLEYFFSQHGWLFREQPTHDYGIDAHIEIVIDAHPTGKLVALQIKSGRSFFTEETEDAFVFRTDDKHIAYWVGHSMPVVVVLFNPETKEAFWQYVSRESVESTGKHWKLSVPKVNMFANPDQTLKAFEALTQPEPYVRRLNRLRIDRRWMDLIEQGTEVRVQFDDWVNKSLPRYQITILTDDERETWPTLYASGIGVEAMLQHFFPWAHFALDDHALREAAESEWASHCYCRDHETGHVFYLEPFDDWYQAQQTPREDLTPISENGETASYSLILSLNDFGRGFLQIDDYLAASDTPENIGFTLD